MLRCEGLNKAYKKTLFEGFNLELNEGEIIAITGPSGCGKTTLLRCICGLESLDEGKITLHDEDITSIPAEKRGMGLLFQTPVLYPHLDVNGNLRLASNDADFSKALGEVGLEGFGDRRIDKLSGGEGQRVALARALLAEPRALLLDEPFSALDRDLAFKLAGEVRELLRERGCPAILVTNDTELAKAFADRVMSL